MEPITERRRRKVVIWRKGMGLLAAVGLAAALSGCAPGTSTDSSPGPHPAPTRGNECIDLPLVTGDPGMVLGTDWSGAHHGYGTTVVVYACLTPQPDGHVRMVADGTGIRVRPHSVALGRSRQGVVPFHVTVLHGASGGIRVQQSGGGVQGDTAGPVVAPDGDGWHFVPRER
jgi:hypothetical protein